MNMILSSSSENPRRLVQRVCCILLLWVSTLDPVVWFLSLHIRFIVGLLGPIRFFVGLLSIFLTYMGCISRILIYKVVDLKKQMKNIYMNYNMYGITLAPFVST